MNITPEIPQLDPIRVQVRKQALMNESARKPSRRGWHVAVPATALAAAVTIGAVWWSTPTQPDPVAVARAVARCQQVFKALQRTPAQPDPSPAPLDSSAVDQRGDVLLVMLTGPDYMQYCMFSGQTTLGFDVMWRVRDTTRFETVRKDAVEGRPARVLAGNVRPEVHGVRIDTADGRHVTAKLDRGWVAAWWPSDAEARLVTLYDEAGHVLGTVVPENR